MIISLGPLVSSRTPKGVMLNSVNTLLVLSSTLQLFLLLANSYLLSETINLYLHINSYVILFLIIINLCLTDITRNFLLIAFYICFLIFLRGQKLFTTEYNTTYTFVQTTLNELQYLKFITIISIAQIFTFIAYKQGVYKQKNIFKNNKQESWKRLLPLVRLIFFITLPCALYMQLKIVIVKSSVSYTDGYLLNVDIPTVIKIANFIWQSIAIVYLAIKPSKNEIKIICLSLLVIQGFIQIFQGRRALFASTLFFLVWYHIKYNNIKIKGKKILYIILGGILLVTLFFYIGVVRSNDSLDVDSIFFIIEYFMISTGGSDSVIANTIVNQDEFPHLGALYLLNPVIFNPITKFIDPNSGLPQGVGYLNTHFDFSHWISYLTEPSLYLSGRGMGSCYLAEIYLAFGLIGVLLISAFLGHVISVFSKIEIGKVGVFNEAIYFLLIKSMFTLPRDGLFSWFGAFIYLMTTFFILSFFKNSKLRRI